MSGDTNNPVYKLITLKLHMVLINVLINNLIIDFLGLAAISWINTMRNNKTTLGLMPNVQCQ